jgi:hypothetical protein
MESGIDYRIVFTVIASLISLGVFINYARTVFKKETKPHLYTWLIWFVTQTVAVVGMWHGGGRTWCNCAHRRYYMRVYGDAVVAKVRYKKYHTE